MVDMNNDLLDPKEPISATEESEVEFDESVCSAEFVCGCTEAVKDQTDED